jgi:CRP-like cAMP-binding protein
MYGVVSGQVALTSAMNAADAPVGLLFNPGDWGGYGPLFGRMRPASSRAVMATTILCVGIGDIRRLLKAQPGWWEHVAMLGFEAGLVYATVAVDLLLPRAERRLAAILLHQAGCRHGGVPWPVHLSQAEVGEMVNLSRHPTRHLLRAFETRGWIDQSYRCITIVAPEPLRALADTGLPHSLSR